MYQSVRQTCWKASRQESPTQVLRRAGGCVPVTIRYDWVLSRKAWPLAESS